MIVEYKKTLGVGHRDLLINLFSEQQKSVASIQNHQYMDFQY